MVLKIAARQSDLARLQAFEVGKALKNAYSEAGFEGQLEIQYQFRSSLGDQRADDPLWQMPEKGVFTEDFVADLRSGAADMVVHSWKDLPIQEREGTVIAATLKRADARDVLLVRRDLWEERVKSRSAGGAPFRVLTSSPRRVYNLAPFLKWALPWPASQGSNAQSPEVEFVPVRGNIATRVRKLVEPEDAKPDGLIVAKAALDRLLTSDQYGPPFDESVRSLRAALSKTMFMVLPLSVNPTAAAQGALAIEVRSDRLDILELCRKIDVATDRACVEEERAELAKHGGGCHQKIGVTILNRPYGRVRFIRGLTDAGLVLNTVQAGEKRRFVWPKAQTEDEVFVSRISEEAREAVPEAISFLNARLQSLVNGRMGFFVARSEAWQPACEKILNEGRQGGADHVVWTAGLATWRKLAACGVWVHGTTESLGEDESPDLETLAGEKVLWTRLTHEAAAVGRDEAVGMYRVRLEVEQELEKSGAAKFFFWKSGLLFREALKARPELSLAYHATGPGQTAKTVAAALLAAAVQRGLDPKQAEEEVAERHAIVLNEDEFKKLVFEKRM
ncbi:MAG: hydroxymethylbilane synthase [Bdellovibrionales bacterium]|jgi:hydroxymethylbilane synthase|nr:hydroxymethylbilane synthase [Bdellovibrionales bacterium]